MNPIRGEEFSVRAGGATDYPQAFATVGGFISVDYTTRNDNAGSGAATQLSSFTLPANALQNNGDRLEFWAHGDQAADGGNKQQKVNFATQNIFSGPASSASNDWWLRGHLVVSDASILTSAKVRYHVDSKTGGTVGNNNYGELTGVNLTTGLLLEVTNTTSSTGATPYAREYVFLCDFVRAPA